MTVKATTIKSSRKATAHPRKVVAKKVSIKVQEAEKPVDESKTISDLPTQIESISEMNIVNEQAPPLDMTNLDNNLTLSLYAVNEMTNNVANLEKEFHMIGTYAKIFIGLGTMGFLTLLYYALWSMHVIK